MCAADYFRELTDTPAPNLPPSLKLRVSDFKVHQQAPNIHPSEQSVMHPHKTESAAMNMTGWGRSL